MIVSFVNFAFSKTQWCVVISLVVQLHWPHTVLEEFDCRNTELQDYSRWRSQQPCRHALDVLGVETMASKRSNTASVQSWVNLSKDDVSTFPQSLNRTRFTSMGPRRDQTGPSISWKLSDQLPCQKIQSSGKERVKDWWVILLRLQIWRLLLLKIDAFNLMRLSRHVWFCQIGKTSITCVW